MFGKQRNKIFSSGVNKHSCIDFGVSLKIAYMLGPGVVVKG